MCGRDVLGMDGVRVMGGTGEGHVCEMVKVCGWNGKQMAYLGLSFEALPGQRLQLQLAGGEVVGTHLRPTTLAKTQTDSGVKSSTHDSVLWMCRVSVLRE